MNFLDAALIKQNNTNNNVSPQNAQSGISKKAMYAHSLLKKAADTFEPIATIGLRKPDEPQKSYIVDSPFYMAPFNFINDIKENIVNIKNAMNGKANDHDLGRMNDFAMKVGGLLLAGYLYTQGKTKMARSMEFIGWGAFFGAMALWPKLFIQAPIKAMHGVDIHQRYVDNEGRNKMFFQDPQYIPWNLYSDEELSALGDRLGVPKDVHNRNELIKKKAHQIALQGNTLWMLTAGFATPLLASMVCNGAERFFSPSQSKLTNSVYKSSENSQIKNALNQVQNLDEVVHKSLERYSPDKLKQILWAHKDRVIDDKFVKSFSAYLQHDSDVMQLKYIPEQINDIVTYEEPKITKEYGKKLYSYLEEKLDDELEDSELKKYFKLTKDKFEEFAETSKNNNELRDKFLDYIDEKMPSHVQAKLEGYISDGLDVYYKKSGGRVLSDDKIKTILRLDKMLYEFSAGKKVIDNYNLSYLNDAAESVTAKTWVNIENVLMSAFNLTGKELKDAKRSAPAAYDVLVQKFEKIAADDEAYKKTFSNVYSSILDFDKALLPDTLENTPQGIKKELIDKYSEFFNNAAKRFEENGFIAIKERLIGNKTDLGALNPNIVSSIEQRILKMRCDLYKVLQVLDLFKRAHEAEKGGIQFAREYLPQLPDVGNVEEFIAKNAKLLDKTAQNLSNEDKVRLIVVKKDFDKFKKFLVKGTVIDYTVKFKFKNFQGDLYDQMMKTMYSTDFAASTKEIIGIAQNGSTEKSAKLGTITFADSFIRHIKNALRNIGNAEYPHEPHVKVRGVSGKSGNYKEIDNYVAIRIDNLINNAASNLYNSKKWLKMFGGATIALIGVTLLAEAFFGRLKAEDIYTKKENKSDKFTSTN